MSWFPDLDLKFLYTILAAFLTAIVALIATILKETRGFNPRLARIESEIELLEKAKKAEVLYTPIEQHVNQQIYSLFTIDKKFTWSYVLKKYFERMGVGLFFLAGTTAGIAGTLGIFYGVIASIYRLDYKFLETSLVSALFAVIGGIVGAFAEDSLKTINNPFDEMKEAKSNTDALIKSLIDFEKSKRSTELAKDTPGKEISIND